MEGVIIKEGSLGAGELEVMDDIVFGFIRREAGHMGREGWIITDGQDFGKI